MLLVLAFFLLLVVLIRTSPVYDQEWALRHHMCPRLSFIHGVTSGCTLLALFIAIMRTVL